MKTILSGAHVVDGHMVRAGNGLVVSHRDEAVATPTTDFDDHYAALDAVEDEASLRDMGQEENGAYSKLRGNPWGPGEKPAHWEDGSSPATAWAADAPMSAGSLYSYEGANYMCIQSHTSQAGSAPEQTARPRCQCCLFWCRLVVRQSGRQAWPTRWTTK